jgi:hypothetical protein
MDAVSNRGLLNRWINYWPLLLIHNIPSNINNVQRTYVPFPFECRLHIATKRGSGHFQYRPADTVILQVLGHRTTRETRCVANVLFLETLVVHVFKVSLSCRNWPRALLNVLKVRAFGMAQVSKSPVPLSYVQTFPIDE